MKDNWIGAAILLAALLTTAVNENRVARRTSALEEGLLRVTPLTDPVSKPENEGKLVLISGVITTDPDVLKADSKSSRTPYVLDSVFGIAARGVRLYRNVEMLQWVETAHTSTIAGDSGGPDDGDRATNERREKTYTYDLKWVAEVVDSMSFHERSFQNPSKDAWIFESKVVEAEAVVVGDFKLSDELIDQITRRDQVELTATALRTMRVVLDQRFGEGWETGSALKDVTMEDNFFYLLRDRGRRPSLGDLRVSFSVTPAYPVTITGRQVLQHILPFDTAIGEPILLLEDGVHSAHELFQGKVSVQYKHNRFYRLFSSTLGFLGFLVIHPYLSMRFGPGFQSIQKHVVCCILSGGLTFGVASLVWLRYRPLWAVLLALVGCSPSVVLGLVVRRKLKLQ